MAENEQHARGHRGGPQEGARAPGTGAETAGLEQLGGGVTRTTLCECLRAECESALGTDCVALVGELDIAGTGALRDLVSSCVSPTIVLDLSRLSFVGAAGVSALVALKGDLEENGQELVLAGAQPPMRRLFSLLLLDEALE